MGWSLNEFKAVLEANPEADFPLGRGYTATKTEFLRQIISFNLDEYIDWGNSSSTFDTDSFVEILEFVAATFPVDPIMGDDFNSPPILFAAGRQIMTDMSFSDLWEYRYNKAMFGGDIVFKGFPGNSEGCHSVTGITGLGITTAAKDKEGAWQFLRTLLDEDYQLSMYTGFPTNKKAFDAYLEQKMNDSNKANEVMCDPETSEMWFELQPIMQEDVANIMTLIDSLSVTTGWTSLDDTFWNIIFESAEDFFNGQNTAQDAARVMQSRAAIYISEHS